VGSRALMGHDGAEPAADERSNWGHPQHHV